MFWRVSIGEAQNLTRVHGTITLENQAPVVNATIVIGSHAVLSNSRGEFEYFADETGKVTIFVRYPGFQSAHFEPFNVNLNGEPVFVNIIIKAKIPPTPTPTPTPALQAPTNLRTRAEPGVVKITWSDTNTGTANESGYEIWRKLRSASQFTLLKRTAQNAVTSNDRTVRSGRTYQYKLRAFKTGSPERFSPWSGISTIAAR